MQIASGEKKTRNYAKIGEDGNASSPRIGFGKTTAGAVPLEEYEASSAQAGDLDEEDSLPSQESQPTTELSGKRPKFRIKKYRTLSQEHGDDAIANDAISSVDNENDIV